MIYSHPEARDFVVDALVQRIRSLQVEPDYIAGTATAAIGWAALVAQKMDLPFVYVRTKAKEHGTQKRVEGDLHPDKHVVLVEDLISTGGSAMSSVEALREEGDAIVTDVVAIFSYEIMAAAEKAQQFAVKLHPISMLSTLLDVAVEQGRLTNEDMGLAASFAQNPKEWGKSL